MIKGEVRSIVGEKKAQELDACYEGTGVAWERVFISYLMRARELDAAAGDEQPSLYFFPD